jgi:hypothetical protein
LELKHAFAGGGIVGLFVFIWFVSGPAPWPNCRLIHQDGLAVPVNSCRFFRAEIGPAPSQGLVDVLDFVVLLIGVGVGVAVAGIASLLAGSFIDSDGLRELLFGERGHRD